MKNLPISSDRLVRFLHNLKKDIGTYSITIYYRSHRSCPLRFEMVPVFPLSNYSTILWCLKVFIVYISFEIWKNLFRPYFRYLHLNTLIATCFWGFWISLQRYTIALWPWPSFLVMIYLSLKMGSVMMVVTISTLYFIEFVYTS